MKTIVDKVFVLIVTLLGVINAFAAPHPPSPGAKTTDTPPPPPGLPIDENVFGLVIVTTLFGIYMIYRYQLKTKAPI